MDWRRLPAADSGRGGAASWQQCGCGCCCEGGSARFTPHTNAGTLVMLAPGPGSLGLSPSRAQTQPGGVQ